MNPTQPLPVADRTRCLLLFSLLSPWLLSQCGTPKVLGNIGDGQVAKVPVVAQAAGIWRATGQSFVKSPANTLRSGVVVLRQRISAAWPGPIRLPGGKAQDTAEFSPGTPGFEAALDAEGLPGRTAGTVQLLIDGREFFPEFTRALQGAQERIDSQTFILDNDPAGVEIARLYQQRAETLPVRVLIDGLGTRTAHRIEPATPPPPGFDPPGFMGRFLGRNSQVRVRVYSNPFLLCDHTKLHLIDGRTAFVGGMNLGQEYRSEWHDQMARIEGPVVAVLQEVFNHHWERENWFRNWTFQNLGKPRLPRQTLEVPPDMMPLRVLRTDAATGTYEIAKAFRAGIAAARTRVWVESPYLAEEGILEDLIAARKRGVDVRVVLPGKNDSKLMEKVNLQGAAKLVEAGIPVLLYPRMTHLKVSICDQWGMFGSANCDTLSLKLNRELNLASADPRFVQQLEQRIFLPDFKSSRRLTLAETQQRKSAVLDAVGNQL